MSISINSNLYRLFRIKQISVITCIIISCFCTTLYGQSNEIGLKSGVLLSGNIAFYEGVLDIGPTSSFGLEYTRNFYENLSINVEYTWANQANTYFRAYGNVNTDNFRSNLQTHYFQVSHIRTYMNTKVAPYTIAGIGLAYFNLDNRGDKTLLGFNLGGGAKVKLSQKINLKLQGRFLLPLLFEGGGFFVDVFNPSNSGFSLYSTIPLLQGELSLSASYRF